MYCIEKAAAAAVPESPFSSERREIRSVMVVFLQVGDGGEGNRKEWAQHLLAVGRLFLARKKKSRVLRVHETKGSHRLDRSKRGRFFSSLPRLTSKTARNQFSHSKNRLFHDSRSGGKFQPRTGGKVRKPHEESGNVGNLGKIRN